MKDMEEMKKRSEALGMFLEMFAEKEDVPIDFKILNKKHKVDRLIMQILESDTFLNNSDDSVEKQNLYEFFKRTEEFLNKFKENFKIQ